MDQNIILAKKNHRCPSCNTHKPLDSFVRKLGQYMGKHSKYQCIDCRVDSMYSDMMKDNPQLQPSPQEAKGIMTALRWLFHEKV